MRHPAVLSCLGLLFCLTVPPVAAQRPVLPGSDGPEVPERAARATGLTVLEEPGLQNVGRSHGRFDCGRVDILTTPEVERVFRVKNEGREPVREVFIRTSCGCEKAEMRRNGQVVNLPSLAPGETLEVRVVVNLSRQRVGVKRVFAWVHGRDVDAPLAELEIVADIRPLVLCDPEIIAFGQFETGQTPSRTLKVTLDRRLAERAGRVILHSYNPAVEVTPEPYREEPGMLDGHPAVVRHYTVKVRPNAPIRPLMAALSFRPETPATAAGTGRDLTRPENAYLLLPPVMVTGEVTGPIAAQPGSLFFGVVPEGTTQKRTVRITGKTVQLLETLQVTASHAFLRATLGPVEMEREQGAAVPFRLLEVTLLPDVRPGPINARLTLRTGTGVEIVLSVVAQVQKKP
ncbi:MAG: DUF1573 domain-containing protein [Chloroherpetonaceae bacterium]|nr:DUF1573 domain-containing protein [Chthonomonadaceae bacterium]MDW8208370.1 DUF1573 domain-containing protein [Chloroherpetonaceae bacterium]